MDRPARVGKGDSDDEHGTSCVYGSPQMSHVCEMPCVFFMSMLSSLGTVIFAPLGNILTDAVVWSYLLFFPLKEEMQRRIIPAKREPAFVTGGMPSIWFSCSCGGHRNVWALAWDIRHEKNRWEISLLVSRAVPLDPPTVSPPRSGHIAHLPTQFSLP